MKNPFQYGKLAEREHFIDRNTDREYIKNALYSGTNVILVSPRRWGKSSVVNQAMLELQDEHPQVKVITIDAFPITSSREFYTTFTREVLRATASHIEMVMEYVGNFLKSLAPKISFSPEPMSNFSFSLEFADSKLDESAILSLPERIAIEKNLQIVVCIDEFQKLAKLPDYDKLESMMRSVWQRHQKVSYCLYGSQRHMMAEIFDSSEKPFYRFGQIYPLKKISEEDWVAYIDERFKSTGKNISPYLAQKIVQIAERHSWYVQQLSSAVWNFTDSEATEHSIEQAIAWCIDVNSGTYQDICDKFTEAQIGLLRAIAKGEAKLSSSDVIHRYNLGTSASVIKNKRMFTNSDIITISGTTSPQFLDPIFKIWFKQNYLK